MHGSWAHLHVQIDKSQTACILCLKCWCTLIWYMRGNDHVEMWMTSFFLVHWEWFWILVEIQSAELGLKWDWPLKPLTIASEPTLLTYISTYLFFLSCQLSLKLDRDLSEELVCLHSLCSRVTRVPPPHPPLCSCWFINFLQLFTKTFVIPKGQKSEVVCWTRVSLFWNMLKMCHPKGPEWLLSDCALMGPWQ